MRIGILAAGQPPERLVEHFGTYPAMFERLLAPAGAGLEFPAWRAFAGELPERPDAADGWLVTGSRAAVYGGHDWIPPLKRFLALAHGAGTPIVGICFGHQILAETLGGRVEKSARGWGIGVHDYRILARAEWMEGAGESFAIEAMHEDQVVAPPPGAEVLAASEFCPYALLAYGRTAISFQGHPEIGADFARAIIAMRRGQLFPQALADDALASLERPADSGLVARWIVRFLEDAGRP